MIRLEKADRRALLVVVRALGRLLRASSAADVSAALEGAVTDLGGALVTADQAGPDALAFDLSCGTGPPTLPRAAVGSGARTRLAHVMPGLVDDARVALARVTQGSRLAEQAEIDVLTGLLNRRASERLLARLGAGDAVALVDLDHFKHVNDDLGHAAGDEVLAAFGQLLRNQGRLEDRYGRLGGDELLCIFPGVSTGEAARALERLRVAWRRIAPHAVTFSAGVAAVDAAGADEALKAADRALYDAKRQGRDIIRVSTSDERHAESAAGREHDTARHEPASAESLLPALLDRLACDDARGATDRVLNALDSGIPLRDVITRLLVPAQREVGRRWEAGEWSVAKEHFATSTFAGALSAAAFRAGRTVVPPPGRMPVVVVCPEGEWHQLPSQMIAALLTEAGMPIVHLGPSLPAQDLRGALADGRYDAVVLTCTLFTSLTTGSATVQVAHEAGLPVLAGGRAFGTDDRRARAIGADGWADDAEQAAEQLRAWWSSPPRLASSPALDVGPPLAQVLDRPTLRQIARRLQRLQASTATTPTLSGATADLDQIVRHLDVAVAVSDPGIFDEFSRWLLSAQSSRGIPVDLLRSSYQALEEEIGPGHPQATALLHRARDLLAAPHARSESCSGHRRVDE